MRPADTAKTRMSTRQNGQNGTVTTPTFHMNGRRESFVDVELTKTALRGKPRYPGTPVGMRLQHATGREIHESTRGKVPESTDVFNLTTGPVSRSSNVDLVSTVG